MKYTEEDLKPTTSHESMLVMALLRKVRGLPVLLLQTNGKLIESTVKSHIDINVNYIKPEPKKLNIPWDHIDPKWNFAAVDQDGSIWFYAEKPEIHMHGDMFYSDYDNIQNTFLLLDVEGVKWETSVTQRPQKDL
jgi:hypothetical protein